MDVSARRGARRAEGRGRGGARAGRGLLGRLPLSAAAAEAEQ